MKEEKENQTDSTLGVVKLLVSLALVGYAVYILTTI